MLRAFNAERISKYLTVCWRHYKSQGTRNIKHIKYGQRM